MATCKPMQTPNTDEYSRETEHRVLTSGLKGNNPDRQLRSLKLAKWETKWEG